MSVYLLILFLDYSSAIRVQEFTSEYACHLEKQKLEDNDFQCISEQTFNEFFELESEDETDDL